MNIEIIFYLAIYHSFYRNKSNFTHELFYKNERLDFKYECNKKESSIFIPESLLDFHFFN
ncbi:hypothetical protein CWI39_0006p0020 [Hamiltosporidium magnivora]|uniref:Uncharacterized protein n=1 Tax=Hamiltosporidium magnivora TaxID=148818 RepID=A0A4Q9LPN7_9MICR|nr:hypothetical protein CWI39_0006p0020 [Hamiltosporidium magnivora]